MGKVLMKFPCHAEGCTRLFDTETGRRVHFGMKHKHEYNKINSTGRVKQGRVESKPVGLVTKIFQCQFKFCTKTFHNERGRRVHESRMHKNKKNFLHENDEEVDYYEEQEEDVDDNDDYYAEDEEDDAEMMDTLGAINELDSLNHLDNFQLDQYSPDIVNGSSSFTLKDCTVKLKKINIKNHQEAENDVSKGYKCWSENCNRVFHNQRGRWVHFGMTHGTWKKKQKKVVEQGTSELKNRKSTIDKQRNEVLSYRGYPYNSRLFKDYPLPSLEELGIQNSNPANVVKLVILPPRESRLSLAKHKNCLVPIGVNDSDAVYEVRSIKKITKNTSSTRKSTIVSEVINENRKIDNDEPEQRKNQQIIQLDFSSKSLVMTETFQSKKMFLPIPSTSLISSTTDPLQCPVCYERFGCLTKLRQHQQTHPDTLPWPCGKCSEFFRHQSQASLHRRKHGR